MREFIYSLEELFLHDALPLVLGAERYYIGSYQRGYKWKSFTANDQVPLSLTDVYEAFQEQQSEYYLQYITIKKAKVNGKDVLEVIDGQQRLTTISLLFYCFDAQFDLDNIVKDTVIYERYLNEERSIFETMLHLSSDDELLRKKQDYYYFFHAKECILQFLAQLSTEEATAFYNYYRKNVKLIINLESDIASAEEIFSNLNDNKVELTNYYLIKGLLFTKSTRADRGKDSFLAVQEQRYRIARNWDELDNWLRDEAHNGLFFHKYDLVNKEEKNIGINSLLNVVKPAKKIKEETRDTPIDKFREKLLERKENDEPVRVDPYELFNLYSDHLRTQEKTLEKLEEIHFTGKRLKNWFQDDETYNLIGYYSCTGGKLDTIINLGRTDLINHLQKHVLAKINPKSKRKEGLNVVNVSELTFSNDKNLLNDILLAINVFPLQKVKGGTEVKIDYSQRFDFHAYRSQKWSIEHIYPQNPAASEEDVNEYKAWFIKKAADKLELVEKIQHGDKLGEEVLKELTKQEFGEHQIGNLALLSGGNNSTLKNYIFPKKRKLLLELVGQGAFVPSHTLYAVCKLLHVTKGQDQEQPTSFSEDLTVWDEADVKANAAWIVNTHLHLVKTLSKPYENRKI